MNGIQTSRRFWLWHAGLPLLLVLVGTMVLRWNGLDLSISQAVFVAGGNSWELGNQMPWKFLYDYGKVPGLLVFFVSLCLLAAGFFWARVRSWRTSALFLVVVMLVGPGLVTNSLLKEYWGRPRPRQVQDFGGRYPFEPVLTYDAGSAGKSFPSGHTAGAAFFMVFYFVGRYRGWPSWMCWGLLGIGFGFGFLMGVARITQGGHFASDVMWAMAVVWLVGCGCAAWIFRPGIAWDKKRKVLRCG